MRRLSCLLTTKYIICLSIAVLQHWFGFFWWGFLCFFGNGTYSFWYWWNSPIVFQVGTVILLLFYPLKHLQQLILKTIYISPGKLNTLLEVQRFVEVHTSFVALQEKHQTSPFPPLPQFSVSALQLLTAVSIGLLSSNLLDRCLRPCSLN